jgi:hypothetical protein
MVERMRQDGGVSRRVYVRSLVLARCGMTHACVLYVALVWRCFFTARAIYAEREEGARAYGSM